MSGNKKPKGLKEDFAKFFENPSREYLRELLRNNIGEMPELDFKEFWLEKSALAKHILAIANSEGGCIVFGVQDETLLPVGLEEITDESIWRSSIGKYIPEPINDFIYSKDFHFEDSEYPKIKGKKFQVIFIEDMPTHIPFISRANGKDIKENAIYIRRGSASEEANYNEIQKLIERRLTTFYSVTTEIELQDHLSQLKVLYHQINKTETDIMSGSFAQLVNLGERIRRSMGYGEKINPNYPGEDFDEFVSKAIELKKILILHEIGVAHLISFDKNI